MIIRESRIGKTLFAFTGCTWILFALLCGLFGDKVTSKQWTYLMSVPGQKWFWAITFGTASLAAIIGLIKHLYLLTALGLFLDATLCLLICAFYVMAPLIDPGLVTLGWVVWLFASVLTYAFAASNLTPVTWF